MYRVPQSNLSYHYSTKAVNLGSMLHDFTYRTSCRTLCFSVKCLFPNICKDLVAYFPHIYPITRLSLMATKASQLSPRRVNIVERARFALAKTPKSHTKHELSAHLSTSCITTSSPLVSFKISLYNYIVVGLSAALSVFGL